mmetsp:Transcript_3424/g.10576  ORF Transcript_3424/g.10576 Transcript_3424/m.10576 type:complete len:397 (+) Transcript_3424:45-1235(+)
MAAEIAARTGVPLAEAERLLEHFGTVEDAVLAHSLGGAPDAPAAGPPAGSPAGAEDGPGLVDSIMAGARRPDDPGVGRELGSAPGPPANDRSLRRRDITTVFFKDGVAFLELPAAEAARPRQTGMHTFKKGPELPQLLQGLEDHRVVTSLTAAHPKYRSTLDQLNAGRVPAVLADGGAEPFVLNATVRDARELPIATLSHAGISGDGAGSAAARFGGAGRTLGAAVPPPRAAGSAEASEGAEAPAATPGLLHASVAATVAGVAVAAAGFGTRMATAAAAIVGGSGYLFAARGERSGGDAAAAAAAAVWTLQVNEGQPTSTLKVRLASRQTVSVQMNDEVHTVADLYRHVETIGTFGRGDFSLASGFPPRVLGADDGTTIAAAGLKGALVTQRATAP